MCNQMMECDLDQAVVAARNREKRVSERANHHQARIQDLAGRLTNYFLDGLHLHDENVMSCHEHCKITYYATLHLLN